MASHWLTQRYLISCADRFDMRIELAIESMCRSGWVRLEKVQTATPSLALSFGVYKGRRGKRIETWNIECSQAQEAKITAFDGGGIGVYPSGHPAARQYAARQVEVRWNGGDNELSTLGALYKAHCEVVDDWIDFERYSRIRRIGKTTCICRGPDFLLRAYAKGLRSMGKHPQISLEKQSDRAPRFKVLHFGDSYVVARGFTGKQL